MAVSTPRVSEEKQMLTHAGIHKGALHWGSDWSGSGSCRCGVSVPKCMHSRSLTAHCLNNCITFPAQLSDAGFLAQQLALLNEVPIGRFKSGN